MTTPPQYQKILPYIDIAKGEGAKCVLGGGPATAAEGGGQYFVKPTIFTGVDNKMRIAQEEVFGPVLSVIKFKDEDEAVEIANDIALRARRRRVDAVASSGRTTMARRIRAGTVWINTYRAVSFLMPFGGYKASGLGRENGAEAIEGYLQTKSVWIFDRIEHRQSVRDENADTELTRPDGAKRQKSARGRGTTAGLNRDVKGGIGTTSRSMLRIENDLPQKSTEIDKVNCLGVRK